MNMINALPGTDPDNTIFEMVNGDLFDPLDPDPDKIEVEVIATVLGNSCRFGGHVPRFYSTAQHSILVAFLAPRDLPAQRYALFHDADETLGLPDMLTMVKKAFGNFVRAQAQIASAVEKRLKLDPADHKRIKPADRQALNLEKLQLRKIGSNSFWQSWTGGLHTPEGITIDPLYPDAAQELFWQAYERVFLAEKPITVEWLNQRPGFTVEPQELRYVDWHDRRVMAA